MIIRQVDDRKRITIPVEILEHLKAKEGDYLILKEVNGKVEIKKAKITEA